MTSTTATERLARIGFVARGLLFLVMGLLAARLAVGDQAEADQRGALDLIARQPFGSVVLVLLSLGFFAYALSRAVRAAQLGDADGPNAVTTRIAEAGRALIYLALGVASALTLMNSSSGSSSGSAAGLMSSTGGRVAIGLAGLAMLGVGGRQIFKIGQEPDELDETSLSEQARRVVGAVRATGLAGRALSFAVVGGFLVHSAVTRDGQAGGLDMALQEVRTTAVGGLVLAGVAIGFAAFGTFCLVQARHHDPA